MRTWEVVSTRGTRYAEAFDSSSSFDCRVALHHARRGYGWIQGRRLLVVRRVLHDADDHYDGGSSRIVAIEPRGTAVQCFSDFVWSKRDVSGARRDDPNDYRARAAGSLWKAQEETHDQRSSRPLYCLRIRTGRPERVV